MNLLPFIIDLKLGKVAYGVPPLRTTGLRYRTCGVFIAPFRHEVIEASFLPLTIDVSSLKTFGIGLHSTYH